MSPIASTYRVCQSRLVLLGAACVIVMAGMPTPGSAAAQPVWVPLAQVKISVSPSSGPAGMAVTVSGSGFTPGGYPGTLNWDGATLLSFPIPDGGAFSIGFGIPAGASPADHTITVCASCGGGEFEQSASTTFRVLAPPTLVPVLPPTLEMMPLPPTPTELPTACSALGLDPAARVIDFESDPTETPLADAYLDSHGVRFLGSAQRVDPGVRAHSGTWGAQSLQTEFGSSDNPVRLEFPAGMQAVGMYVGMEAAVETRGPVTAVLQAFGFRAGTGDLVLLGTGTATFPARGEPVRHCLSFTAAEGDIISRATADYQDDTGRSIFEPRLLDDLLLLPTSLTLPADQPPVVHILSPAEGQTFREGEVVLQARIREDRSLEAAHWRIDWRLGSTGGELGVDPAGGPGEYLVTLRRSVEGFLLPDTENALVVLAVDSAGQRGEDRVTIHYVPPPDLDLEIVGVEATQATQCLNRSDCTGVPLIAGRPTLVRAYLRAVAGGPVAGVTGDLCYWLPGEVAGGECIHRVTPLWPVEALAEADPVVAHRGDLRRTLNFLLPDEAVRRSGTLYVQIRLNPGRDPEECCYENNDTRPGWATIRPEEQLNVVFIPVDLADASATLDQRWRLVDWLLRAYPVTHVQTYTVEGGDAMRVNPLDLAAFEVFGGNLWDVVLYELGWVNAWHDDPVDGLRYYGMVPDVAQPMTGGVGGMGYLSGHESAGIVPTTEMEEGWAARYAVDWAAGTTSALMVAGHVAAEELGHNYGRLHATDACSAASPDRRYPVAEGRLDDWGTDVRQVLACAAPGPVVVGGAGASVVDACNAALYDPAGAHDYMGYCDIRDRAWTSMYTYRAMIDAIGRVALPGTGHSVARVAGPPLETAMVLVGSGVATPEHLTPLSAFYLLPDSEAPATEMTDGPYRAILLSAAGERLAEIPFGPIETSNAEPGISGVAYLRLPWLTGASIVAFEYQGREIGRVTASARAPQVRLTSPNGGETWNASGTKRIGWEAEDADGDALVAVVQYSVDGGGTWRAVAVDVEDDQAEVDLASLTGSDQAMVRVTVSDGFNTASDASDATFTVEGKPPEVFLASPAEGAEYPYGWPVLLEGFFSDREDVTTLNGADAAWDSSLDGRLGQGDWLLAERLSPGRHRLTLTVTDSSGLTGTAQVNIVILNPDGSAPPGPPPSPPLAWVIGLAAIGVLGAALLIGAAGSALAARARRRRRRGAATD